MAGLGQAILALQRLWRQVSFRIMFHFTVPSGSAMALEGKARAQPYLSDLIPTLLKGQ